MTYLRATLLCMLALIASITATAQVTDEAAAKVTSPNGQITFLLFTGAATADGGQAAQESPVPQGLRYAVEFRGKRLIAESQLGLELAGQPALGPEMRRTGTETGAVDKSYTIPVGKTSTVRDHYNSLRTDFADATGRKLSIEVRVFDDGIGFRYVVPEQPSLHRVRPRSYGVQLWKGRHHLSADSRRIPIIVGRRVPAASGERAAFRLAHRFALSG
jgi:alpha-glucosidase